MQKRVTLSLIINALVICSIGQIHKDITVTQADSLITANSANPNFNILDVRTPEEYSNGHIQYAINIDYYSSTFGIQLDTHNKDDIYLLMKSDKGRGLFVAGPFGHAADASLLEFEDSAEIQAAPKVTF